MAAPSTLTNRNALLAHRARAAIRPETFLHDIVADELNERLLEVNKTFTAPAVIGPMDSLLPEAHHVLDDDRLALQPAAHDLIIDGMSLHWANDPVGQIVQSRLALKPDGLYLAALFGGQTLHELRTALAEAESALRGGLSPRVAPMADIRDLGQLLSRAGLALTVADSTTIRTSYQSLKDLVRDLRGMGETNALFARDTTIPPRALFDLTESIYREHFSEEGRLVATWEIVFLTGWAPDDSQPKPLRPGSATHRLSDALGVPELPSGDKTDPKPS